MSMERTMSQGRFKISRTTRGADFTLSAASKLALPVRREAALRLAVVLAGCVTFLVMVGGCATPAPRLAQQHVERGDILLEQQKLESALKEFQAAAELEPQMAVAHSRMGVVYQQLGEFARAAESFVEAIRINPFSFKETFKLAQVYYFMQRLHEAIQAYLHAVELEPLDFDARLNLGVCYQELGEFEQAAEHFNRSIEIDSARPHGFVNLGVALDAQGKYYEAIGAYKEALERDARQAGSTGRQPLVLVNIARTYMNQDRLKLARHALEQAIQREPQLATAHEALGYCLFRMGDYHEAKRSYKRALAYEWRLPRAHVGIGSINMLDYLADNTLTKRRDRALEHWHRSLELSPDQPRIRKLIARYQPKARNPEQILLNEHGLP